MRRPPLRLLLILLGLVLASASTDGPGLVVARAGEVPVVRIGLDLESNPVTISSESDWWLGIQRSGLRPVQVPASRSWRFSAIGGSRVLAGDGDYERTVSDTLYVHPAPGKDGVLRIGDRSYRGELLIYAKEGKLVVVNVIDLESYLLGVVPLEIGGQNDARFEALKAQAVAARSYTLSNLGRWRAEGFDLKGNVQDQAYGGRDAENERCAAAVEATRGVVAVWKGSPILAYYSSTSGGHTASASEVWDRTDLPYLQGVRNRTSRVKDSFCEISPYYKWDEIWSAADFDAMLGRSLPGQIPGWTREEYGRFRDLEIRARSESKRVRDLVVRFERGEVVLHEDGIRWAIRRPDGSALRSSLLERVGVRVAGGRPAEVKIRGRGYGHGVGLCQYGAMGMSEVGYDYTQILRFYYRGTELRRYY